MELELFEVYNLELLLVVDVFVLLQFIDKPLNDPLVRSEISRYGWVIAFVLVLEYHLVNA